MYLSGYIDLALTALAFDSESVDLGASLPLTISTTVTPGSSTSGVNSFTAGSNNYEYQVYLSRNKEELQYRLRKCDLLCYYHYEICLLSFICNSHSFRYICNYY